MDGVELENLVVRLTGDGTQYQSMLNQATNATRSFASTAISALSSIGAMAYLKQAFSAFQDRQETMLRLTAVIKANGHAVEATLEQYKAFATGMMEVSTETKGAILNNLKMAESFGLTGTTAQKAVKDAMGIAAINEGGAGSFLRVTQAIAKGDIATAMRFSRMIPQLRGVRNEMEFMSKYSKLVEAGMDTMAAQANTAGGQITRLGIAFRSLLGDMGETVAEGIKPIVQWLRDAVQWFQGLSKEAKEAIAIVTGMIAVAVALTGAITLAGFVFNTMFGGAGILIGVLVSAGAALAVWVYHIGGVKKAWDLIKSAAGTAWTWIKEKADAFFSWFHPIWQATVSLAKEGWEIIKDVAMVTWDFIKSQAMTTWNNLKAVWQGIFGDAEVNWDKVREVIMDILIAVEFGLKNAGKLSDLVWAGMSSKVVELGNDFEYLFKDVIPSLLSWFAENWVDVFKTAFNFTMVANSNMVKNIVDVIKNLPGLIAGTTDWSDVLTPLDKGLIITLKELPKIPERQMGELERTLKAEYAKLGKETAISFMDFRNKKLAEFAAAGLISDDAEKAAEASGQELGNAMSKGIGSELKRVDAVLYNTNEALSRIDEYREMLSRGPGNKDVGGGAVVRVEAAASGSNEAESRELEQLAVLRETRDILREQAKRPAMEVQPAGIA